MNALQKEVKIQKKNKGLLITSIILTVVMLIITIYCGYSAYLMTVSYGQAYGYPSQAALMNALFSRVVGAIYLPLFLLSIAFASLIVFATFVKRKKVTIAKIKEEMGVEQ